MADDDVTQDGPEAPKAKRKKQTLTEEQQALVVRMLAHFHGQTEVRDYLKQHHGVDVTTNCIHRYDPRTKQGATLPQKWKDLFAEERRQAQEEIGEIPIAHRPMRLMRLQELANQARAQGNYLKELQVLEQAAKEVGNMFTNKREVTGADGGPIRTTREQSDDELEARMKQILAHPEIAERLEAWTKPDETPSVH